MVAIETSKRKFHRLLENLTSSSAPEAPNSEPPAAKRVRLHSDILVSQKGSSSVPGTSESITSRPTLRPVARTSLRHKASRVTASDSPRKPPNYVPWNHDRFLERLKTFADVRLWTLKPDAINEVYWARRGWTCDGINRVACKGGCEQRVVLALRPRRKDEAGNEIEDSEDFSVEVDPELVERYVELIKTGHGETCLWRTTGSCKDDIYRLPIARSAIWQPQLRERYQSLQALADYLPPLSRINAPVDAEQIVPCISAVILESQTSSQSAHPANDTNHTTNDTTAAAASGYVDSNQAAIALALFGWHGTLSGPGYGLATCNACFRRIGLWLYRQSDDQDTDEAAEQGDETMKLDLVGNHRDYCPWINATSQSAVGALAGLTGWQILQRVIKDAADFKRSGSNVRPDSMESQTGANNETSEPAAPMILQRKTVEETEKEDKARFARLRNLTKSLGLKKFKAKLGRTGTVTTSGAPKT